ncbi:MAG: WYL domain-containing protein [bacterium]|nr:WYL domain-containing protein [bacterium]
MKRIHRLIRLIRVLQEGEFHSVDDLARILGVSRRTVFRDLSSLEAAGVPATFDRQEQGYRLDREHFLPPLSLNFEEALTLLLLSRRAINQKMFPGRRAAASAALKIESALPGNLRRHCGEMLSAVDMRYWPTSELDGTSDLLIQLQQAVAHKRKVALHYDSLFKGEGQIETVLCVYRLAFIRRGWYAIGFSERHRQVRTFKVERIVDLRLLEHTYSIDESFSLDDHFGDAWQMIRGDRKYHVIIRFNKKVATNVEEVVWHRTQQTRYLPGGDLLFEVDVDGLNEIVWWILGYGHEAEVEQPLELRRLVAEHVRALADKYKIGNPPGRGAT